MGAEGASRRRIVGWAAVVCAATILLAIGGPLIGRGLLIGSDVTRTVPPWDADTPTSFVYRHGGINDTVDAGAPAREAIRQELVDDLRLPLWDPYPNGGAPLGSVPNSGTLAPINWPLLALGVSHGLAWAAFLRLSVAAIGMFFLLRRLGTSRFAGVCGGLIYCTSGFLIVWNNYPQADIAAMIPLLFLAADLLRERRRAINVLALAAVVAAMVLEGYLPLLVVVLYALAAFLVVRWWEASRGDDPDRPSLWARLRAAVTPAGLIIAALALGAMLVAFQLVPLARGLDAYDITYRQDNANRLVPPAALLTSAFPWAQGSPAHPETLAVLNPEVRRFTVNFVEQFSFLGVAAVVMILWALLRGRPSRVSRGVYGYCVAGMALLLLVLFGNSVGPLPDIGARITDALYLLPGINQVPLMRFVAPLLFFGTLLAAFGVEHVVDPGGRPLRLDRRVVARIGVVLAALAYLAYRPVRDEITLLVDRRSTDFWGSTVIHVASQRGWILRNSVVPALIAIGAVAVIFVAWKSHGRWRTVALATLPVLFAVEGLMVTTPMLPRVPDSDYFPKTGVTRYLEAHLGHQRVAPAGKAMLYYATNTMYGIRSVSGHSFTDKNWQKLLYATHPEYQLMLQNRLGQGLAVATAPILDRLGARFYAATPTAVPFGTPQAAPPATGSVTVGNGARASGPIAPGPLRAVQVQVVGREQLRGDLVYLDAEVRDQSGKVLARGTRRVVDQLATTTYYLAMTGEGIPASTPLHVELSLRSGRRDSVHLAATAAGAVSVGVIRPAADGLRVAYADEGGVIYRRLNALPRIRWASKASVKDPGQTFLSLQHGVPADTVVLAQRGRAADGAPAHVVVRRDSGDQIRVGVNAQGAGYLVVADAIQSGWDVRLDGRPVALVKADLGLVAIHVPKGKHTIELAARPRGWRAGIALSLAALAVVVGLLGWVVIRRRRRGNAPASAPDPLSPAPFAATEAREALGVPEPSEPVPTPDVAAPLPVGPGPAPEPTTEPARETGSVVEPRGALRWLLLVACVVVLIGVAVWFRYRAVGIPSLWLDDAWVGVGAHFSSIGDTVRSGLTSPGFSLIYRGWAAVFGDGPTTAQMLSVSFAIAAPVVLFLAATERGLPWFAALLGGGLLATAPAHIDMSTRFKQYTAEAFFATLVLWLAWRVLDRPDSSRRWAGFAALAIAASLVSTIGVLIAGSALAVCIVAVLLARPRVLRPAVIATVAYGLIVGVWILLAVRPNVHAKLADYWRGSYLDGSGFAGGLGTRLQVLAHGFQGISAPIVLLGLAVAAGIVLVRRPLVGLLLVLPTGIAVLLAALAVAPIGTGRTDVYLFPSYALLVAVAVAEVAAMLAPRARWATGAIVGVTLTAFVLVAVAATPSPALGTPCPDPPVEGSSLLRCPYPQENINPLVRTVEQKRRPGDTILVYPSSDFAYGLATRYPIERVPDALSATDWKVKVKGPNILILEPHRKDTQKWDGPLDQLVRGSPRIWLIGSHFFPDWKVLKGKLLMRSYWPVRTYSRDGAELDLFVPKSSLPTTTSPNP